MGGLLRAVRLLAMTIWVGGLVFFAFVLAPVAFHVLPSTHEAGLVVSGTLPILHWMGMVCGGLFLLATMVLERGSPRRGALIAIGLVVFMLAVTVYLQASVLPRMERDRAAVGGDVAAAAPSNPARADFDRLHPLSERMEGAALLAGLGVVCLMGVAAKPGLKLDGA